jgi:hypothetical protein
MSAEPLLHSAGLSAPQAVPDPHMEGYPSLSCWPPAPRPTPYFNSWPSTRSMTTGIPATSLHQTPAQNWSHSLPGYPPPPTTTTAHCPSEPAEPRQHIGWSDPHLAHQALPGSSWVLKTGAPPSWDRHHPGARQPHSPACQEPRSLCGAGPSSTGFPDNNSTRLPLCSH